jgi:2-succinyl-5-enolpyruvyl-6-hydroxy-3-cyclohexene-1-carboxylate synthase
LSLAARCDRLVVVHPPGRPADPSRRASPNVEADVSAAAAALCAEIGERRPRHTPWLRAWEEADAAARTAVDALLDGYAEPFEGRIARDLAAALPRGATLVAGSSLPIRDVDAFMAPRMGLRVIGNRGASGIDGLVATALGAAAANDDGPTCALLGDLTLLHDAGTLLWSGRAPLDATIVVANNRGGRIFSLLAQRDLPEHERLFATPHDVDLGAVAAAAGIGHARVHRSDGLAPAVEDASAPGGIRLVEVAIDPARSVARYAEVRRTVAAAIAASS